MGENHAQNHLICFSINDRAHVSHRRLWIRHLRVLQSCTAGLGGGPTGQPSLACSRNVYDLLRPSVIPFPLYKYEYWYLFIYFGRKKNMDQPHTTASWAPPCLHKNECNNPAVVLIRMTRSDQGISERQFTYIKCRIKKSVVSIAVLSGGWIKCISSHLEWIICLRSQMISWSRGLTSLLRAGVLRVSLTIFFCPQVWWGRVEMSVGLGWDTLTWSYDQLDSVVRKVLTNGFVLSHRPRNGTRTCTRSRFLDKLWRTTSRNCPFFWTRIHFLLAFYVPLKNVPRVNRLP